jgi:hypothetical protein
MRILTFDQLTQSLTDATKNLTVDELGELVDHLGYGTLEELRQERWFYHIENVVPKEINAEMIHTLWVLLISVHEERYMANKTV